MVIYQRRLPELPTFLVVLSHIEHKHDAAHVAERIVNAFLDKFELAKGVYAVGTSIGVSLFPSDGSDGDTLLRKADSAMYAVEASGKSAFRFYDQRAPGLAPE